MEEELVLVAVVVVERGGSRVELTGDCDDIYIGKDDRDTASTATNNNGKNKHQPYQHQLTEF